MCTSRPSGSVDVQVEADRRRGRVRDGLRVEHGERGLERRCGLDAHARQPREELGDRPLDAAAAGDPLPARLDHADEPVALVDRDDRVAVRRARAVDDQRLGVGLELEPRVRRLQRGPRRQLELGLRRAGRARVERDDGAGDAASAAGTRGRPGAGTRSTARRPCGSRRAPASARRAAGTRGRPSAATSTSRRRRGCGARRGAAGGGGPRRSRPGTARSARPRPRRRARAGSATRTGPPLRSSGTGSSWSPGVVDGDARAREVEAAPAVRARQLAADELAAGEVGRAAGAAVAVGQQRAGDVGDDEAVPRGDEPPALQPGHAGELDPLGVGRRRRAPRRGRRRPRRRARAGRAPSPRARARSRARAWPATRRSRCTSPRRRSRATPSATPSSSTSPPWDSM